MITRIIVIYLLVSTNFLSSLPMAAIGGPGGGIVGLGGAAGGPGGAGAGVGGTVGNPPGFITVGAQYNLPCSNQAMIETTGQIWAVGAPVYHPLPAFMNYTPLGRFPVPPSPLGPSNHVVHAPQSRNGSYLLQANIPIDVAHNAANNTCVPWDPAGRERCGHTPHDVSIHNCRTLFGSGLCSSFQKFLPFLRFFHKFLHPFLHINQIY